MKRFILFLILSSALLPAADTAPRRAPGFSIVDTHQQQHDLADYRGKYVIIDFMQTGCPHCIKFGETLEQLMIKYRGKLQALSITLPPDNMGTATNYVKQHNVTIPVLYDLGQVAMSYLRPGPMNPTVHFPHVYLIDPAGNIVGDWEYTDIKPGIFEGDQFAKEIERVLGGKK